MAPFTDFVIREKYPTLDFSGRVENTRKYAFTVSFSYHTRGKQKVVVIEDIPNLHGIFLEHSNLTICQTSNNSKNSYPWSSLSSILDQHHWDQWYSLSAILQRRAMQLYA